MAQYDLQYSQLLHSHLLMASSFPNNMPMVPNINSHHHPISPTSHHHPQFQSFSPSPSSTLTFPPQTPNSDPYSVPGSPFPMQSYYNPMVEQMDSSSQPSRTVYLGNIPPELTMEQLLNYVHSGVVESAKMIPEKSCAFISFLNHASAFHFYSDAILRKLSINSYDIKIGWGKPSSLPPQVALAVSQDGATRNIYLGNLPNDITEEEIRQEMSKFGKIDTINLLKDRNIAFVHFLSISTAIKVVETLSILDESAEENPEISKELIAKWTQRKVFYGKDRCAYISKTQQQNAAQYLGIAPGYEHLLASADRDLISSALAQQSAAAVAVATAAGGASNVGNRTLYLGFVHPETTIEEICNVVRGGLLHNIRYIPEKHICFVTFVDPTAAAQFFALATLQGLAIHNRRLKIGWGKPSGPLPQAIAMAVTAGASRNVYIGSISSDWPESKLRHDFQEFGEIEQINFLPEKSCAFVNFTNIANAIKAIEGIKAKEEYKDLKINFGKDRCANPSRHMLQQHVSKNAPVNMNGSINYDSTTSNSSLSSPVSSASSASSNSNNAGLYNSNVINPANIALYNTAAAAAAAFSPIGGVGYPMLDPHLRGYLQNSPQASSPIELNGNGFFNGPLPGNSQYRVPYFSNDTSTTITIPEEDEGEEEISNTTNTKYKKNFKSNQTNNTKSSVSSAKSTSSPELSDDERTSVEEETSASTTGLLPKDSQKSLQDLDNDVDTKSSQSETTMIGSEDTSVSSISTAITSSSSVTIVDTSKPSKSNKSIPTLHKVVASIDYKVIDEETAAAAASEAAKAFGL